MRTRMEDGCREPAPGVRERRMDAPACDPRVRDRRTDAASVRDRRNNPASGGGSSSVRVRVLRCRMLLSHVRKPSRVRPPRGSGVPARATRQGLPRPRHRAPADCRRRPPWRRRPGIARRGRHRRRQPARTAGRAADRGARPGTVALRAMPEQLDCARTPDVGGDGLGGGQRSGQNRQAEPHRLGQRLGHPGGHDEARPSVPGCGHVIHGEHRARTHFSARGGVPCHIRQHPQRIGRIQRDLQVPDAFLKQRERARTAASASVPRMIASSRDASKPARKSCALMLFTILRRIRRCAATPVSATSCHADRRREPQPRPPRCPAPGR